MWSTVEDVQYLCNGRQLQCGLLDGQEHASQLEWFATFSTCAACQQVVMPSLAHLSVPASTSWDALLRCRACQRGTLRPATPSCAQAWMGTGRRL